MKEKIKLFISKVLAIYKKVVDFVKKAIVFTKKYGFGIVNFLVLFLLYGVAYINVDTKGFVIAIGGLWMLFIAGRLLYKLWAGTLFKEDEE